MTEMQASDRSHRCSIISAAAISPPAVEQCGAVLAAHFQSGESKDELPDKIYVI